MPLLAIALAGVSVLHESPARQERAPQSSTLPAAKLEGLRAELERLQEQFHVPGMSAALVHRHALAWSHGIGYADLEHGIWAEPDTRYRLASVSKPFAAVLILQLVEQGKLSLDSPMKDFHLHTWFAPDPKRYQEQPVLLRHVLTHTSEGVPGDAYSYSGNIYSDLTWVLEEVTHTAYPRLLQERIFDKVGMERSVPGHVRPGNNEHVLGTWQMMDPDPALDLTGFDPVYRMPEEMLAARKALLGDSFVHLNAVSAAGEMTSTVLDLAKFDAALDDDRLITAQSRELMFTPAVSNSGKALPYALGWFVEEIAGRKVMWHYGWLPPSVSALYVKVPAVELSFVLLANNDRLSESFAWTAKGVRASPFACAFLGAFGLMGE